MKEIRDLARDTRIEYDTLMEYLTNRIPVLDKEKLFLDAEMFTLDDFFSLPLPYWIEPITTPHAPLGKVADVVMEQYEGNLDSIENANRDIAWCAWLQRHWNWARLGTIEIKVNPKPPYYTTADGNHRSVVLACMITAGQTDFRKGCFRLTKYESGEKWKHITPLLDADEFTPITTPETLLNIACIYPPCEPDNAIGHRSIAQWIDGYYRTLDRQSEIYQAITKAVDTFDRQAVKFLTDYDLHLSDWIHAKEPKTIQDADGNAMIINIDDLLRKRHLWILAYCIRLSQGFVKFTPIPMLPDFFLLDGIG